MRYNCVFFSFQLKACPLPDAKAMLLIGYNQAELSVFNIIADQGMCTEKHIALTLFQLRQYLLSF